MRRRPWLALPFVAQALSVGLAQVPPTLREAAQALGSSPASYAMSW